MKKRQFTFSQFNKDAAQRTYQRIQQQPFVVQNLPGPKQQQLLLQASKLRKQSYSTWQYVFVGIYDKSDPLYKLQQVVWPHWKIQLIGNYDHNMLVSYYKQRLNFQECWTIDDTLSTQIVMNFGSFRSLGSIQNWQLHGLVKKIGLVKQPQKYVSNQVTYNKNKSSIYFELNTLYAPLKQVLQWYGFMFGQWAIIDQRKKDKAKQQLQQLGIPQLITGNVISDLNNVLPLIRLNRTQSMNVRQPVRNEPRTQLMTYSSTLIWANGTNQRSDEQIHNDPISSQIYNNPSNPANQSNVQTSNITHTQSQLQNTTNTINNQSNLQTSTITHTQNHLQANTMNNQSNLITQNNTYSQNQPQNNTITSQTPSTQVQNLNNQHVQTVNNTTNQPIQNNYETNIHRMINSHQRVSNQQNNMPHVSQNTQILPKPPSKYQAIGQKIRSQRLARSANISSSTHISMPMSTPPQMGMPRQMNMPPPQMGMSAQMSIPPHMSVSSSIITPTQSNIPVIMVPHPFQNRLNQSVPVNQQPIEPKSKRNVNKRTSKSKKQQVTPKQPQSQKQSSTLKTKKQRLAFYQNQPTPSKQVISTKQRKPRSKKEKVYPQQPKTYQYLKQQPVTRIKQQPKHQKQQQPITISIESTPLHSKQQSQSSQIQEQVYKTFKRTSHNNEQFTQQQNLSRQSSRININAQFKSQQQSSYIHSQPQQYTSSQQESQSQSDDIIQQKPVSKKK